MRLLKDDENGIAAAAEALRAGLLVAFPTETVYGLGADAFNTAALARVFAAKNRPHFDPLIIHIAALESVGYVADLDALPEKGRKNFEILSRNLWPGPLTLILPKQSEVPDLATSGLPTAAVRFPSHPAALKIIGAAAWGNNPARAIAAPSANPFGRLSPTRAEHVREQLGDRIDVLVDGGPCAVGVESTVLDLTVEPPRILRPGGTPREQIEALIGVVEVNSNTVEDRVTVASPGQLKSHYAPRTPLVLHTPEVMAALDPRPGEGYLFFSGASRDARPGAVGDGPVVRVLSVSGDSTEAAANLFQILHQMDGLGLSLLHAERAPEQGLGPAINDRLSRAAGG